jgi:hypothetical protein
LLLFSIHSPSTNVTTRIGLDTTTVIDNGEKDEASASQNLDYAEDELN